MNQEQNNLNQNNFNTQGNNGIPNNQPLQNNQNLNNTFNQSVNVSQSTFNNQPQVSSNYQQQYSQINVRESTPQTINNFDNNIKNKSSNKVKLVLIIGLIVILVIIMAIFILKFILSKINLGNSFVIPTSVFERNGDNYVLKDEKGKIILDNIASHGEFCNGTAEVKNTNGEYGIINGKGDFIVEYKKYSDISQYSCFYKVTDKSNNGYQKYILKYDGSILVKDDNDKVLQNSILHDYTSSNRYALLETEKEYKLLNYLGDTLISIAKVSSAKAPKIISNGFHVSSDQYVSLFYNNKTYIFDLEKSKQILSAFDGTFSVNDIDDSTTTTNIIAGIEFKKGIETIIIFGHLPDEETPKTYVVNKGKITYETNDCFNAFVSNGKVSCLIQRGGDYKYFDINGREVEK